MKRCPQCEFIYENEQETCDMDGATLALDKTVAVADGERSMMKSFVVPAAFGTALAAVIGLAFFSSPLLVAKPDARQLAPQQMPVAPVTSPTPITPDVDGPSPAQSPESLPDPITREQTAAVRTSDANHVNRSPSDSKLSIKRGLPPLPRVPTLPRLPPARVKKTPTANDKVQVTSIQPKKQSKVESFLKKTGRVITKPFKF